MAGTCGYGEGLSGSINAGNFLTSCKVYWLASQEGLCSMELVSPTTTNKCTIISQIITLLHVSTISCHPQGAFNQSLPSYTSISNAAVGNELDGFSWGGK